MNEFEVPISHPRAAVYGHRAFISIKTYSGYRSGWADPEGGQLYLTPDASDEELGEALVKALSASRVFILEDRSIIVRETFAEWYEAWVANVM